MADYRLIARGAAVRAAARYLAHLEMAAPAVALRRILGLRPFWGPGPETIGSGNPGLTPGEVTYIWRVRSALRARRSMRGDWPRKEAVRVFMRRDQAAGGAPL